MSRAPPFPTRRARSPSLISSASGPAQNSGQASSATRPLQIARPPSRPTTPSNSGYITGTPPRGSIPNNAVTGPSRPQRSELRTRVSEYSASDRASTSSRDPYRDSVSTVRSDASHQHRPRPGPSNNQGMPSTVRAKPQRMDSVPPNDGDRTPIDTVMSAFQSAGRRRAMTNGSDDLEYQRERQKEIEAENVRQQRIRDKVPGRRVNGKARAGDIDGMFPILWVPHHSQKHRNHP